jgi:hypothetical protein
MPCLRDGWLPEQTSQPGAVEGRDRAGKAGDAESLNALLQQFIIGLEAVVQFAAPRTPDREG